MTVPSGNTNPDQTSDEKLILLTELSMLLKRQEVIDVSPAVLRRWCKEGARSIERPVPVYLPHQKIGRWYYSSLSRVREFLLSQME